MSSKSKFYVDLIENSHGDDRAIWKAINEVTHRDKQRSTINSMVSDGITYSDPSAIAKLLNGYFTSIATFLASKLPCVSFPDQKRLITNALNLHCRISTMILCIAN